jgi:hypothetical protein
LRYEQERARQLEVEFGQLQLELSTWGTAPRIEKIAREKLGCARRKPKGDHRTAPAWRRVAMMRFKGKVAHKFAESPLLQLRLPPGVRA